MISRGSGLTEDRSRESNAISLSAERLVSDEVSLDISFGDALRSLFSEGPNTGLKNIFYSIFGTSGAVRGLGFELTGIDQLSNDEKHRLKDGILSLQGLEGSWREKLQNGAILTALDLTREPGAVKGNTELINYLESKAEPGDIIFVSAGGNGQTATGEIFENLVRRISAYEDGDKKFPFVHVLVVRQDKKLIDLTMLGRKYRSFEDVFINLGKYNGIALTRLDESAETRTEFAKSAFGFLKGKMYNYGWLLMLAPWLVKSRRDDPFSDGSVTKDSGVCVDVVTEGAERLRKRKGVDLGIDLREAATPLDLFSSKKLQVVAALRLFS